MPRRPPERPRRRPALFVLAFIVVVAGVASVASAQTSAEDDELVATGRDLYGAECSTCHGAEGRGIDDEGPPIGDASPALVDFMIRTGRMPLPDPNAPSVRRQPALSAEERNAVVAYMRTFAADEPGIPDVAPEDGDLGEGREVYETNCIACHSAFGRGIAVSQTDIAPALDASTPVEIAEAVRVGPGVMPVFGDDVIDEEELNSVITYVQFLRDRPSPGGVTIGRSGPVTEGFVAWGVGLVLLLVAVYFIGERRGD